MADNKGMTRLKRIIEPSAIVHAIWRVANGVFRLDDRDVRNEYCRGLARVIPKSDWGLLAFALMSNHIHLALLAGASSFGNLAQAIHSPFVRWLNLRQGKDAKLFSDRPKTIVVSPENTLRLIAYIHNNPLRAEGGAKDRQESWTSYRYYRGIERRPNWVSVEMGLRLSGYRDDAEDRASFCQAVDAFSSEARDPVLSADNLVSARRNLRSALGSAVEANYPTVVNGTDLLYAPQVHADGRTRERWPGDLEQLARKVCAHLAVDLKDLYSNNRARWVANARKVFVLVGRLLNIPSIALTAHLALDVSSASKYVARATAADRAVAQLIASGVRNPESVK
jgi:REP element-mobilizing transposase RayT